MGNRWLRAIQWLGGLVIVGFVARHLVRNWTEVRAADLTWHLSVAPILAGLLLVLLAFWLLSGAWRTMVRGWGYPLAWWPATRIWLLSSLAKYVPGKVWALAGMAVMAKQGGVPPWVATGSAIILQILSLGTGAVVVAVTGGGVLDGAGIPRGGGLRCSSW